MNRSHICSLSLISSPWSMKGATNQVDTPNRLLLPLPTGLKVPGHQDDYSLLCWPWRSQAHGQLGWWAWGKCNSAQSAVCKIKQLQVFSGNLDPNCCCTGNPPWPGTPPLSPASSQDWGNDLYSFMIFQVEIMIVILYTKPCPKIWPMLQRIQVIRNHKLSRIINPI